MTTALPIPVVLPPAPAAGGGILGRATMLEPGWERGVSFATEACLTAGEHVFCVDSPTEKQFQGGTLADFNPYGIEVGVVCTTLGGERADAEREARAFQALEVVAEYSVGYVLATGETQAGEDTGNPALADATSQGTAATATAALALLEDVTAETLRGHRAWYHLAPSTLTQLVADGSVVGDVDDGWFSPTGHIVVASPGYADTLADKIVATTEVYASVGDIVLMRTMDYATNRKLALHEAPALAVMDPCFNVSVGITSSP